jgi:Tol biopolymer transport system component
VTAAEQDLQAGLPPTRLRRLPAWALALALVLAACSAGPSPGASSSGTPRHSAAPSAEVSTARTIGDGEEWIVYQGVELGFNLVRPDGSGRHVILGPPGDQLHPDWSPDGSRIAYVQATDTSFEVWITDAQGLHPEPLVTSYPEEVAGRFWDNPAWSRDGSRIAMVGYDGSPDSGVPERAALAIVEVSSRELSIAFDYALDDPISLLSFPRWSPDGDAMVMTVGRFDEDGEFTGEAIAVSTLEGATWSTPVILTPFEDYATRPDWHPTDGLLVFVTHDVGYLQSTDEPSNLFTVRPDGTELTQITDFGAGEDRASQPTWTSDGRIIFTLIRGANDEQRNIAFVNADGSELEIVTEAVVGDDNRPHPRLRPVP